MTCATAANETLTIAKAAAMARTPASMPPTLDERPAILRYRETRSHGRDLRCLGSSSRCFKKVTPSRRGAGGSWVPGPPVFRARRVCLSGERTGGSSILDLPSARVRYTPREVNRGDVGVDVDARQQAG